MRFNKEDIYMDDDITDGNTNREISGYMWAHDSLCDIAGYKGELETEDYINFYPVYNVDTDEFKVICSWLVGTDAKEFDLDLTQDELDYIFSVFVETYWETKENFDDFVEEWKVRLSNDDLKEVEI